jgi:hypothetical protein
MKGGASFGNLKIGGLTFKSNSVTYSLSIVLLVFFLIYSLTALGMAGTLFSSAMGLIAYGIFGTVEAAMAVTITAGILLKVAFPGFKRAAEGFQAKGAAAAAPTVPLTEDAIITDRIRRMKPGGILEGFSSEGAEGTAPATSAKETHSGSEGEAAVTAAPAPVHVAAEEEKDKAVALAESKDVAGFADKASTDGLFKLGELPSEAKDGNYIDVGTTIMRSLGALKPDQLNQMTADTRTLLETQKSLMSMLTTMKPMLMDGQQLLGSFSGLFKQ